MLCVYFAFLVSTDPFKYIIGTWLLCFFASWTWTLFTLIELGILPFHQSQVSQNIFERHLRRLKRNDKTTRLPDRNRVNFYGKWQERLLAISFLNMQISRTNEQLSRLYFWNLERMIGHHVHSTGAGLSFMGDGREIFSQSISWTCKYHRLMNS